MATGTIELSFETYKPDYISDLNLEVESVIEKHRLRLLNEMEKRFSVGDFIKVIHKGSSRIEYYKIEKIIVNQSGFNTINPYLIGRRINKNQIYSKGTRRIIWSNKHASIFKVTQDELEKFQGHKRKTKKYIDRSLYFFRNEIGLIKIGQAINVEERRKSIEMQSGNKISVLNIIKHSASFESKLHEHYSKYRVIGEWFKLPSNEISNLKHADPDTIQFITK